jgi:predicted permease
MALGASRGRILRQVFTESLLLSCLGGGAGFLLGYLGRNAIPRLMSNSWEPPQIFSHFDWKIFAFTAGISILTGLLFGLAPALQSTRVSVNAALKDSATTIIKRRKGVTGKAIVVFQVSLSMLLVVGAGLFIRTLFNLSGQEIGFRPENILLFRIQPPYSRYTSPKIIEVERQIEERLTTVPGVAAVTLSAEPLLANTMSNDDFVPDEQAQKPDRGEQTVLINFVGDAFFNTMGIPLMAGRGFDKRDTATSPKVAVVNRSLALKFYPTTNPIGKTFNKDHIRIIGISADAKYSDLREETPPTAYFSYRQESDASDGVTFEVRLKSDPQAVLPAIRDAIASVDKDLPLVDVRTQTEQIDEILSNERLFAALAGAFGVLALVLACIGIYGIMAYTVARRTNEIGIRIALGAQTGQVLRMVLGEASWLAVCGIAIGLGCALWLTRFLSSLLYGLKPSDPVTLIVAALLLLAAALAAGWTPAWRASQVQPMEALRHE